MDFSTVIFASILVVLGVILILRVRDMLRDDPRFETYRDRQLIAYEERRMRVTRDRVWQRVDSLHVEFTRREAAGGPRVSNGSAPRHAQAGGDSRGVKPGEARAVSERTVAARHDRRGDDPPRPL